MAVHTLPKNCTIVQPPLSPAFFSNVGQVYLYHTVLVLLVYFKVLATEKYKKKKKKKLLQNYRHGG